MLFVPNKNKYHLCSNLQSFFFKITIYKLFIFPLRIITILKYVEINTFIFPLDEYTHNVA